MKINNFKQGQVVKASALHLFPNFPWVPPLPPPGKTVLQPDAQATYDIVQSFLLHELWEVTVETGFSKRWLRSYI